MMKIETDISKNTLLVLVVITLIVSLVGSFIIADSMSKGPAAQESSSSDAASSSANVQLEVKKPLDNSAHISVNIVKPK